MSPFITRMWSFNTMGPRRRPDNTNSFAAGAVSKVTF